MIFELAGYGLAFCHLCIVVAGEWGYLIPGTPGVTATLETLSQSGIVKSSVVQENAFLLKFVSGPPGTVE
jgi:hypothetical protein